MGDFSWVAQCNTKDFSRALRARKKKIANKIQKYVLFGIFFPLPHKKTVGGCVMSAIERESDNANSALKFGSWEVSARRLSLAAFSCLVSSVPVR